MTPAERERALVVAHLERHADMATTGIEYDRGWAMCAFNAAREIERGDHLSAGLSASGIPLTKERQ